MSKKEIDNYGKLMLLSAKKVFNVEDVAIYTGHQTSYVYKLIHERKIPYYKREGGKFVYFKKTDIDDWMLSHRVAPIEELQEQALKFVTKNNVQYVGFSPFKKNNYELNDDDLSEQPKRENKSKPTTTPKKEDIKKGKIKTKKTTLKKNKDDEDSQKKHKRNVKKAPSKSRKRQRKK